MATTLDFMIVQVRVNPGTASEVTHDVLVSVDYRGVSSPDSGPTKNCAPKVTLPGLSKGDVVDVIWGFPSGTNITATPQAFAPIVELRRVG